MEFSTSRRWRWCRAFLSLVCAAGVLEHPAFADDLRRRVRREGIVLYQLKPQATPQQIADVERLMARHRPAGAAAMGLAAGLPLRQSHRAMAVAGGRESEDDIAQALRETGAVAFAEPDYLQYPAVTPNDPDYGQQWHHDHIGSEGAWDITKGQSNITVAVVDSGVDASHPDLAGRVLGGHNVVDGSDNASPIADHGTEVAGAMAAAGNNGIGVAGEAWNVKILPVRITNSRDTSAWCSDMASGIEWAADHGAKVINLSYNTVGCPNVINAAATYARTRGALVFVAAGNSSLNLSGTYPDNASYVLVGATDQSDMRATFSNFGTPVDLVAPGVSIWTTKPGGYAAPSGTSFASPIAAGVAALIYSIKPDFTPDQVERFILSTAKESGALATDSVYGRGLLDAEAAVTAAYSVASGNKPPTIQISAPASVVWPATARLVVSVSDDGLPSVPGKVTRRWSKISGPGAVEFTSENGDTVSARFSYAGRYRLRLTATDGALRASRDAYITVNPGPHGEGGLPAPTLLVPRLLSLKGRVTATYPSNYAIAQYEWSFQPTTPALARSAGSQPGTISASWSTTANSAELAPRSLSPGYYQVSVQALDTQGVLSEPARAYVTLVSADLEEMRVFPNPWRSDRHQALPLTFDQLSEDATVKIFTIAGHLLRTLSSADAKVAWDLRTDGGDTVASGLYLYLVQDPHGQKRTGKFAVIR